MYRDSKLWNRVRARVLRHGESRNHVAKTEGLSRQTVRKILRHERPVGYGGETQPPAPIRIKPSSIPRKGRKAKVSRERWINWLADLVRGDVSSNDLPENLLAEVVPTTQSRRVKAMTILAKCHGFSNNEISSFLAISKVTVRRYAAEYASGGTDGLFSRSPKPLMANDEYLKKAIFVLLHEPPSIHNINRTTWRMSDLQSILNSQGHKVGIEVIRTIIKDAGYRWRSAKVVLTSNDPDYLEKLKHIQSILVELRDDERFFSIDEFGPFAIKMKPGKVLAPPDVQPSVPQWQKSKGWLILTAALELSTNQITHFYSTAKNTVEMIRMARLLLNEYADCRKIYLSWDAASWHMSKELIKFMEKHNSEAGINKRPEIELAPLPASAQFLILNVIESVFSGMARAIIHNSDYPSVEAAKEAIDRHFKERNQHFLDNPKRAGNKIWGMERTSSEFSESNNCKDPAFR